MSEEGAKSHEEVVRGYLIDALRRELDGPDLPPRGTDIRDGQEWIEVLQESQIQRYSAGVLFPQSQPNNEVENSDDSANSSSDADADTKSEPELPMEGDQGAEVKR